MSLYWVRPVRVHAGPALRQYCFEGNATAAHGGRPLHVGTLT